MFEKNEVIYNKVDKKIKLVILFFLLTATILFISYANIQKKSDIEYIDHWVPIPYREFASGDLIKMI